METREHKKEMREHLEITSDVTKEDFTQQHFYKVYAVEKVFADAVFKQAVLEQCYFRNCKFIRCDFTGTAFKSSNFRGAQFDGCKFIYSTWEKTILEENFLEYCLPSEENLARDLIQELRVNFSQIGNYPAVNRASSLEVKLTGIHLYKSAYSKESYYRSKYKGMARTKKALDHLKWKFFDLLWGNGESVIRVIASALFVILAISLAGTLSSSGTFLQVATSSFLTFWGIQAQSAISNYLAVPLIISRFLFFGLFMAILVKRLSRR